MLNNSRLKGWVNKWMNEWLNERTTVSFLGPYITGPRKHWPHAHFLLRNHRLNPYPVFLKRASQMSGPLNTEADSNLDLTIRHLLGCRETSPRIGTAQEMLGKGAPGPLVLQALRIISVNLRNWHNPTLLERRPPQADAVKLRPRTSPRLLRHFSP